MTDNKWIWFACLVPTILALLAVLTAPISTSGKFWAASGVSFVYLVVMWVAGEKRDG